MDGGTSSQDQGEQNLSGPRSMGQADLHGIEMASHVGRIDVGYGHVEPRARPTDFFGGSDNRFCSAEDFPHGIAAGNMPESSMLQFAGGAYNGALPIALHGPDIASQCRYQRLRHLESKRFQGVHEPGNLFHVTSGKRIMNDGHGAPPPHGPAGDTAPLQKNIFPRQSYSSIPHLTLYTTPTLPTPRPSPRPS